MATQDEDDLLTPDALAASLYRQAQSQEAWHLLRPEDAMSPIIDEVKQRLEDECHQHVLEIERLKRYIGFDPAQYQALQDSLQRTNELLKARVDALETLLRVQEDSLADNISRHGTTSDTALQAVSQDGESAKRLLSSWRQQVFVLLLQQTATQEAHAHAQARCQQELAEQADALHATQQALYLKEQTVATVSAQLDLVQCDAETQQSQLQHQAQTVDNLFHENRLLARAHQLNQEGVQQCYRFFERQYQQLAQGHAQLELQQRRLAFAANRLTTVQHAIKRKLALTENDVPPSSLEQTRDDLVAELANAQAQLTLSQDQMQELERERSFLLNENQTLQVSFQQRVEQRVAAERSRLGEAQAELAKQSATQDSLVAELHSAQKGIEDKNQVMAQLQHDLAQARAINARTLSELKEQHVQELQQAKSQAGEAADELHRQIAQLNVEKGQLSLNVKQAERRLETQAARLTSEFEVERMQLKQTVDDLEQRLHQVQQELNTVTSNLRSQAHQAYLAAPPLGDQTARPPAVLSSSQQRRPLPVDRYGLLGQPPAQAHESATANSDMEGLMQEIASVTDKILSGLEPT
eukprot:m.73185 g.73185  ORF g.73185 m.73185 type:complete len:583 (+) comp14314_c0_seq2:159-1907(+)